MRLLLNPNSDDGGGTNPPANPPVNPPASPTVQVDATQYQTLLAAQTRLAQIEAERQQRESQSEAERHKAMIEKGQAEEAFKAFKADVEPKLESLSKQAERYRSRLHSEAKSAAVANAFAGVQFVSDEARSQALQLAAANLEVIEDAEGNLAVRQPGTGIVASEFLKAQIASPAYAHFLKASTQGGSGATNRQPAGGVNPQTAEAINRKAIDILQRNQLSSNPFARLMSGN